MTLRLSPAFTIRNQKGCSYIVRIDSIINKSSEDFGVLPIPPFIGYILSRLGRYEYDRDMEVLAEETGLTTDAVRNFVSQLSDNEFHKEFKLSEDNSIVFPPNFIVQTDKPISRVNSYDSDDFDWADDFQIQRPRMPFSVNLMVTTKCTTSCCYCYANRTLQPLLSTERIVQLIRELKAGGVVNIALTGGDIFVHEGWKTILREMIENGYKPFLSTKTPLDEASLSLLHDLGYTALQFSLDSEDKDVLAYLINVPHDYISKVAKMFADCEKYDINLSVRSVLTKLNGSIESVKRLYSFLSKYSSVKMWSMTPAFLSEYKKEQYQNLEADNEDLKAVYAFAQESDLHMPINLNKIGDDGYRLKRSETTDEFVCTNQICLGNTTCLSILANGKCSVCEMLYDHPEYILGDINETDVYSIWNSKKALELYSPSQTDTTSDSPCKSCSVFDKCKLQFGKRVCYADIAKTGFSKDHPDPRCPLSTNTNYIL